MSESNPPTLRVSFLGTGAGNCIHRAHTAIVLDCPDGTRLLLDCASGNAALQHGAAIGMLADSFNTVLLSHSHQDHMSGLPFIQSQRRLVNLGGPPVQVHATEETLSAVQSLFRVVARNLVVDQNGAAHREGQQEAVWRPASPGEWWQLGPQTRARCFPVDHLPGAVGWRVESGGLEVVFSGDTKFCPAVAEAAQGADLLIHEALCLDNDAQSASQRGHSTAGQAARIAAEAGVKQLILTHIDSPFHHDTGPLLVEARRYYNGPSSVADDLTQIALK